VGPKFFNTMAGPLALFLLFLTGVGPLIAWRRASPRMLRRQFALPVSAGVVTALALAALLRGRADFYGLVAWSLGAFVTATIVQEYARAIRVRVRKGDENALQAWC
jgi:cytochrome c-type biogenesis protein CcmF